MRTLPQACAVAAHALILTSCIAAGGGTGPSGPAAVAERYPTVPSGVVPCPGPGVDASRAIQAALEGAAPGAVVTLESGTYSLAAPVWVRGAFRGTLRGAGRDQTRIRILPGARLDGVASGGQGALSLSTLFLFDIPPDQAGDVTLADFSIEVGESSPAGAQDDPDRWRGALASLVAVQGVAVSTRFERLSLKAGEGGLDGTNVAAGIHVAGAGGTFMSGRQTCSEVRFENMRVACAIGQQSHSRIRIVGGTFVETGYGAVVEDTTECAIEVASNRILASAAGVVVLQGSPMAGWAGSTCVVSLNDLLAQGGGDGIVLEDQAGSPRLEALVLANRIEVDGGSGTGIQLGGVHGAVVSGNRIWGNGAAGIGLGAAGAPSGNCLVTGNEVDGFQAAVAPIWLGEAASDCIVAGFGTPTWVLDQGSGNHFLGPQIQPAPGPGRELRPALRVPQDLDRLLGRPRD